MSTDKKSQNISKIFLYVMLFFTIVSLATLYYKYLIIKDFIIL